jgi:rhodanese-related sulfurtransferase
MTAVRLFGNVAVVLGAAAAFAGSPYSEQHGRIDVDELSTMVRNEDDHVTAIELARWIKARREGLRVIDVRSAADYETFHVPSAEHVSIDSLVAARFSPSETIVLYSEGGPHAAQAWVFLRALGFKKVYFLRGGVYEWVEQVVEPTLPLGVSASESAAFDSIAALSRYFGGTPKRGVARPTDAAIAVPRTTDSSNAKSVAPEPSTAIAKIRRRGC